MAPNSCSLTFPPLRHSSSRYQMVLMNLYTGALGFCSSRYKSRHNPPSQFFSEKEGDSAYRNKLLRPDDSTDWPRLVIEVGDSESLPPLQTDGKWWIENSRGQVRIVLLLKIDTKKKRTIRILKYVSVPPSSSSRYNLRHDPVSVPCLP